MTISGLSKHAWTVHHLIECNVVCTPGQIYWKKSFLSKFFNATLHSRTIIIHLSYLIQGVKYLISKLTSVTMVFQKSCEWITICLFNASVYHCLNGPFFPKHSVCICCKHVIACSAHYLDIGYKHIFKNWQKSSSFRLSLRRLKY